MQSASPSNLKISTAALIGQGVLAIGDGYRAKNVELAKHGYPFARAGNIDNGFDFGDADRFPEKDLHKVGEKTSRPGDVVFTSKGTVGRFAYVKDNTESFVYSPQLCYWRSLDHDVVHPRYLFYWMHGREFFEQATGLKGQTDMADYINLGDQRRMNLTLPSIGRQRAIASVLGALDDKIELNLQMNRTLEEMASALFKSWFVDFEPVLAKAEGRKPFGMDEATAALFPSEFEETDEGPVPKGWTWCAVADVADLNPESWSKRNAPDKVLYLDLSNVKWGVAEEPVEYRFSEAPSRARRVRRGAICTVTSASGRTPCWPATATTWSARSLWASPRPPSARRCGCRRSRAWKSSMSPRARRTAT